MEENKVKNNKSRKNIILIVVIGLVVVNFIYIYNLKKEIRYLSDKTEEATPFLNMRPEAREEFKKDMLEKERAKQNEEKYIAGVKQEQEQYRENKKQEQEAKEAALGYHTGITYEQLARNPDEYKGKKATFSGKVVQVVEGEKETTIRLAVDSNYDSIMMLGIPRSIKLKSRILESDIITAKGRSLGIMTYQSALGGPITVPALIVDAVVE